jgi:hypothetical protein
MKKKKSKKLIKAFLNLCREMFNEDYELTDFLIPPLHVKKRDKFYWHHPDYKRPLPIKSYNIFNSYYCSSNNVTFYVMPGWIYFKPKNLLLKNLPKVSHAWFENFIKTHLVYNIGSFQPEISQHQNGVAFDI